MLEFTVQYSGLTVYVEASWEPAGVGQRGCWGWTVADVIVSQPEFWTPGLDPWEWVTSADGEDTLGPLVLAECAKLDQEGRDEAAYEAYVADRDYRRVGFD